MQAVRRIVNIRLAGKQIREDAMREEIREMLKEKADSEYRDFSSSLIPEGKPLIGVRLPVLRKLAKELVKGDWRAEICSYTGEYKDIYFEETMLRGMMIGYGTAKGECEEGLRYVEQFIPYIDNWSLCDSFCSSFLLAERYRGEVWEFLQPYLYSDKEFEVRTALITLLCHYLKYNADGGKSPRKRVVSMADMQTAADGGKFPYRDRILEVLNRPYGQGYYAQMAAAWTAAEAFAVFPYEMGRLLGGECKMDDWTYNKALQKICESRIPDDEVKAEMRGRKK